MNLLFENTFNVNKDSYFVFTILYFLLRLAFLHLRPVVMIEEVDGFELVSSFVSRTPFVNVSFVPTLDTISFSDLMSLSVRKSPETFPFKSSFYFQSQNMSDLLFVL